MHVVFTLKMFYLLFSPEGKHGFFLGGGGIDEVKCNVDIDYK
jgi:hypothetical protein